MANVVAWNFPVYFVNPIPKGGVGSGFLITDRDLDDPFFENSTITITAQPLDLGVDLEVIQVTIARILPGIPRYNVWYAVKNHSGPDINSFQTCVSVIKE
jgi:hypothetical protein